MTPPLHGINTARCNAPRRTECESKLSQLGFGEGFSRVQPAFGSLSTLRVEFRLRSLEADSSKPRVERYHAAFCATFVTKERVFNGGYVQVKLPVRIAAYWTVGLPLAWAVRLEQLEVVA